MPPRHDDDNDDADEKEDNDDSSDEDGDDDGDNEGGIDRDCKMQDEVRYDHHNDGDDNCDC